MHGKAKNKIRKRHKFPMRIFLSEKCICKVKARSTNKKPVKPDSIKIPYLYCYKQSDIDLRLVGLKNLLCFVKTYLGNSLMLKILRQPNSTYCQ